MKHLYLSTPVNTILKNDKWQFLVFNYNDEHCYITNKYVHTTNVNLLL